MAKREIAGTIADATLPRTPITIGGHEYNLCFDLGALAEAETAINAEYARAKSDERVNLLVALSNLNLANTRIMFAASVRAFHPEIRFADALQLPALSELFGVVKAIEMAWLASTTNGDQRTARPPEPGDIDLKPGE